MHASGTDTVVAAVNVVKVKGSLQGFSFRGRYDVSDY
jgi:hypothetical protein